jgi:hypothetical protein
MQFVIEQACQMATIYAIIATRMPTVNDFCISRAVGGYLLLYHLCRQVRQSKVANDCGRYQSESSAVSWHGRPVADAQ